LGPGACAGWRSIDFLGNVLFAIEGGLMRKRLRWSTGDQLRQMSERECQRPSPDATEILGLMRADIPILNRVRRRLQGG
jgi:hypothetical protein